MSEFIFGFLGGTVAALAGLRLWRWWVRSRISCIRPYRLARIGKGGAASSGKAKG